MDTGYPDMCISPNSNDKWAPVPKIFGPDAGQDDAAKLKEILIKIQKENESVCAEADKIVSGERNEQYGDPVTNAAKIAEIATPLLKDYLKEGVKLDGRAVAFFMIALKLARELHQHKRDSIVDAIGYLKILHMVSEAKP